MEGVVIANVSWVSVRLWFVFGQCPLCCVTQCHKAQNDRHQKGRKRHAGCVDKCSVHCMCITSLFMLVSFPVASQQAFSVAQYLSTVCWK